MALVSESVGQEGLGRRITFPIGARPLNIERRHDGRPRIETKRRLVQQDLEQITEPAPRLWLGGLVTGLRWRNW
jgi:hypothetical protein